MTVDDHSKLKYHRAILFPHSYLPQRAKEGILSSFATLTVCQPWFMENGGDAESGKGRIDILRPPEFLKPPEDFRKLLAEYREWMSRNRGVYPLSPKTGEDASWEIRGALRRKGKDDQKLIREQALRWHLILHLERELEESQTSADEMLLRIKAERSPLAEALGDAAPSDGFLDDLAISNSHPSIEERHIRQVMSAWFGLFGRSLPEDGILLTMTPAVLYYTEGLFETEPLQTSMQERGSYPSKIDLPASSMDVSAETDPLRVALSGKSLILLNGA